MSAFALPFCSPDLIRRSRPAFCVAFFGWVQGPYPSYPPERFSEPFDQNPLSRTFLCGGGFGGLWLSLPYRLSWVYLLERPVKLVSPNWADEWSRLRRLDFFGRKGAPEKARGAAPIKLG